MPTPTEEIIQLKKLHIGLIELNRLEERKDEILNTLDNKKQSLKECVYPPYNPPQAPSVQADRRQKGRGLLGLNQSKAEWAFFIAACALVLTGLAIMLFALLSSTDISFFVELKKHWYLGLAIILLFIMIFLAIRLMTHKLKLSGKKNRGKLADRYRKYIKVSFGNTLIEYDKKYNHECQEIKQSYDNKMSEYLNISQEFESELKRIEEKTAALKKEIALCDLFSDRLKNLEDTKGILKVIENKEAQTLKEAINIYMGYNG